MEAFDELADNHVNFDNLVGGKRREAALTKALQGEQRQGVGTSL